MAFSIIPLLTGVRNPDQGIMTYQQGYGRSIWLPIWAFLVQSEENNILVDTGLDENELIVPPGFTEETGLSPVTIKEGLSDQGLAPADIDYVINTHLHDDHCGNNMLFKKARFFAHREEISFCKNPHPIDHRYDEYFIEETTFTEIERDMEVLPGLKAIHMPGHTVGTLSILIETGQGPAVITGFCCNNKNFPENGPAICPGVHLDAVAAWNSIQKVKNMGAIIIPMHELSIQPIKGETIRSSR